jgi:formylglycine-generating enzyme required for sulfatase activity
LPEGARIGTDSAGTFADLVFHVKDGPPVSQRLRLIPAGSFWMGSPKREPGRFNAEGPRHKVTIGSPFWLADTPCTQALWQAVMGNNPSRFQSPDRPVEQVSFTDVEEFLAKVNDQLRGARLVLPSEAQWEYACRAGTRTATYGGAMEILGQNNAPVLDRLGWYGGNSGQDFELDNGVDASGWPEKQYPHTKAGTHSVKGKDPNGWGLYDMLGNVWEWCADHWHDTYDGAPADGSAWLDPAAAGDAGRVIRGGAWGNDARHVRSACRRGDTAETRYNRYNTLGFRFALVQR